MCCTKCFNGVSEDRRNEVKYSHRFLIWISPNRFVLIMCLVFLEAAFLGANSQSKIVQPVLLRLVCDTT